ncbi:MAG: transglutaminase-like domain-containing protein [Planctomycetia bacterium]
MSGESEGGLRYWHPGMSSGRRRATVTADGVSSAGVSADDEHSDRSLLHCFTAGLAIIAMAVFLITDADGGRSESGLWTQIVAEALLTVILTIVAQRNRQLIDAHPAVTPLLILVPIVSLLWEPTQRLLLGSGRPFEMMMMHSQKNLMLALAIVGLHPAVQRMSLFIGVILCVFSAAMTREHRIYWIVAGYGFCAVSWLILGYWSGIRVRMLREHAQRLPFQWLVAGPAIALFAAAATIAGGRNELSSLRGFFPGSGGEGDYDEYSRGGVNDGDALVAGRDDIRSFGPIDEAPMADSEKPSLYDVINDRFDEPLRKNKSVQRAIALPPDIMASVQQRLSTVRHAGREFSTLRRKSEKGKNRAAGISSTALLYVSGRVPLHLRTEVFDVFDGVTWYAAEPPADPLRLSFVSIRGKPWLQIPVHGNVSEFQTFTETHAVKPVNLKLPTIPSPLGTRLLHMEHVDRVDMFAWKNDSLICMNRDSLPELVPIHLQSDVLDQKSLRSQKLLSFSAVRMTLEKSLPEGPELDRIRSLAESWTKEIPRGMGQIDAICSRLRAEYSLDRDIQFVDGDTTPLTQFLFEIRRGPEYQFATAAAVMLRSVGYATRLVSGFYARPERYDARGRHTSVHGSDAHFWCEVFVGGSKWATIEPSPGYVVPGPPLRWFEQLLLSVTDFLGHCRRQWPLCLSGMAGLAVLFRFRNDLRSAVFTLLWTWFP